jgi:hypothetical protein
VNDPARLREGGPGTSPELKHLFADAAKPDPLPPAVDARLSAHIGAIGALPASSLVKLTSWLVVGGAVVAAGAVMVVVQRRPARSEVTPAPPAPITAPAPVVPAPTIPEIQETPNPPDNKAHAPSSPVRASAPESASATPEDALAGEAKLLNEAHDVMASDPRKALAIAGEHAKRYPHGQLAAERDLILVQALVKLGRTREAEARARVLRKSTPNSIYGERLDTILHGK